MSRHRLAGVQRIAVSAALLALIFHVIFCNEVQLQFKAAGRDWNALSRWEQRSLAWRTGPKALWHTATRLDALSLMTSFAACGALVVLGGLRWRSVLRVQGLHLSLREVLRISFIAHFFNAFLLGTAGGDVIKAWYAARAAPERRPEAALTVFADRLLGTLGLLLFAAVFAIPNYRLILEYKNHAVLALTILGMLGVASVLVILGFYTNYLQPGGPLTRWAAKLPKGGSFVRGLAACRAFGHHAGFMTEMAVWSLLANICIVAAFASLAHGLEVDVPLITLAYVVPAIVSVAALPITPAGLGVREGMFVSLLGIGIFHAKPGAAFSLSILGYTVNLAWSAIGGVVYALAPASDKAIVRSTATAIQPAKP